MELSIVIPSYLEEENLRVLLPRIIGSTKELNIPFEVLIMDTQEPMDNTRAVCAEHGVRYINREKGNKYGDAIRTSLKYATGNYVLYMDADGSHSPEFIKNMYQSRADNDIVIASRYIDGGGSDNTGTLIFMSWMVNFIYSALFNLKCKDVSNSFKLYKRDKLAALELRSDNFDIIEEILIKLKRKNKQLKLKEIPYVFKERMFGHTKRNLFAFAISYVFTLIKLKFRQ